MASTARQVLAAMQSALQGIDGSGSYNYDLSDSADRVRLGSPTQTPARTCLYLAAATLEADVGEAPMGMWRRSLECSVIGFIGATTKSKGDRVLEAWDLCADVVRALETDLTLGGLTLHLDITASATADGDEAGGFEARVRTYWQSTAAGGV